MPLSEYPPGLTPGEFCEWGFSKPKVYATKLRDIPALQNELPTRL